MYTCRLTLVDDGIGFVRPSSGEHIKSEGALRLDFRPTDSKLPEHEWVRTFQIFLPRVADGEHLDKSLNCARTVSPVGVDIDLVKSWVRNCQSWHNECDIKRWADAPQVQSGLRVIDVHRQCLMRLPDGGEYIALSYVWGGVPSFRLTTQKQHDLSKVGSLAEVALPRTIRDSISLVRRIETSYLWVDAVCLVQDDADEVRMLEHMDSIYGHALFTIVAAAGIDADAGLSGVQPDSRPVVQPVVEVFPRTKLTIEVLPSAAKLERSTWNCRAWTYQERLMSRRILIFEEHQMSWRCINEEWRESRILEHPHRIRRKGVSPRFKGSDIGKYYQSGLTNTTRPVYGRRLLRTGELDTYFGTVEAYSLRNLTYEQDVLNAFAGLAKGHTAAMNSSFFQGLPEGFFDMSLLWQRKEGPLVRRSSCPTALQNPPQIQSDTTLFPSWSWAGWEGSVQCLRFELPDVSRHRHEERVRSVIRWYRLTRPGTDLSSLLNAGTAVPVVNTDIFVRIQQAHEDPRNIPQRPEEGVEPAHLVDQLRYAQQLPGRNQSAVGAGDIQTTEDYISSVSSLEMALGLAAAHAHLERYGWQGGSEEVVVHRGLHWAMSISTDRKVLVESPEKQKHRNPNAKMAPQVFSEVDTEAAEEFLPGSESMKILQTPNRDVEMDIIMQLQVRVRDFRYLYFYSSCVFFRVSSDKHLDTFGARYDLQGKRSLDPHEQASEFGRRHHVLQGLNEVVRIVGWVQLHSDDEDFQTDPHVHEFVVVSEAQLYGKKELDSAIYGGEPLNRHWRQFRLWNVLLVEWKNGVAYRIGMGRVWKFAWQIHRPTLKLVTLG